MRYRQKCGFLRFTHDWNVYTILYVHFHIPHIISFPKMCMVNVIRRADHENCQNHHFTSHSLFLLGRWCSFISVVDGVPGARHTHIIYHSARLDLRNTKTQKVSLLQHPLGTLEERTKFCSVPCSHQNTLFSSSIPNGCCNRLTFCVLVFLKSKQVEWYMICMCLAPGTQSTTDMKEYPLP